VLFNDAVSTQSLCKMGWNGHTKVTAVLKVAPKESCVFSKRFVFESKSCVCIWNSCETERFILNDSSGNKLICKFTFPATADVFIDVVVYRKEALDHVPQSEIVRGQTDNFEL
jgi:hypothetical protein